MTLNTEEFLQTTTGDVLDDHLDPCIPGEWLFIAGKPSIASFVYKTGDREGETGYRMVLPWTCQAQEVLDALDRERVTVTQSVLLDLTDDGTGLDMGKGKNITLGQIRTALGQNVAGADWSPAMIEGQPAVLKIRAGVYEDRATAEVQSARAP